MHFQLYPSIKDEKNTDVTGEDSEDMRKNRDKAINEYLGKLK
jgi:hypothetical protein